MTSANTAHGLACYLLIRLWAALVTLLLLLPVKVAAWVKPPLHVGGRGAGGRTRIVVSPHQLVDVASTFWPSRRRPGPGVLVLSSSGPGPSPSPRGRGGNSTPSDGRKSTYKGDNSSNGGRRWLGGGGGQVEWSLRRVRSTVSLELIDSAKAAGLLPDANLYQPAIRECRYVNDGAKALELLLEMHARGEGQQRGPLRVGEGDCVCVMRACGGAGMVDEALQVFHTYMPQWGVPRRQGSFAAAISCCSRGGRWDDASYLFHTLMPSEGVVPDGVCYAAMMESYRRQGQGHKAVQLYQQLQASSVTWTSGAIAASMRCLTEAGNAAEALHVFKTHGPMCVPRPHEHVLEGDEASMLGLTAASGPWCGAVVGVRLDTAAYAAALDATAELGEGSEAVGLLEGIKAEGLRMATHMYDTAARACSRGGDAESALRVLHVMGGQGGSMSEWGYGWVLSTCAEAGLWDKALTLYYSMPIQGALPNRALALLSRALVEAGEGPRAVDLLAQEEARRRSLLSSSKDMPKATASARGPDHEDAKAPSTDVAEEGHPLTTLGGVWATLVAKAAALAPPHHNTTHTVPPLAMGRGALEAALHYLTQATLSPAEGGNLVGYMLEADLGRIIENSCQAGCVSSARALLEACNSRLPQRTNVIMHTSVLNRLAFQGGLGEALSLMSEMEGRGIAADVVLLTTLLDACLKEGAMEEAAVLSTRLKQRPSTAPPPRASLRAPEDDEGSVWAPDVTALGVRLRECVARGDTQEGVRLLREACEGPLPVLCYSVVLGGAAKEGHWRDAIEVLSLMRSRGVEGSEADLTAAIRACAKAGRWEAADELLQIMRASGLAENTVPYSLVLSAMGKGGQEEDTL